MTPDEAVFVRSSACTSGSCVEVHIGTQIVFVRDSKDTSDTTLRFTHEEWDAFVSGVKADEFALPKAVTGGVANPAVVV